MARCVYCLHTLVPKDERESPLNPSLEHFIPWSLGGSNGFATMDACTECNSTLGDTVDAATINQPLLAMIRQQFGITGYSGNVPDVVMPMRSMDTNEPGRMTIPPVGEVEYHHKPVVVRQPHALGEELLVVGSEDDVRKIVQGIADKEAKRGRRLVDPSSGQTIDLDDSIASAEREITDLYRARTVISLPPIYRTMAKAAYGLAHHMFGWRWTGSYDAASLRDAARGLTSDDDVVAMMQGIRTEFRDKLPLPAGQQDHHVVAFVPGASPSIFVSLFGEALFTALIPVTVSDEATELGICENNRAMVAIDPRSRAATWTDFLTYVQHLQQ
ncbi:hypothetical protein EJC47_11060 [Sphingomonas sp. TF3]|uniref:HNH endonuclease n=1 Tax=Sphingomonas sp. TF3 TaxID=2495580 RepID=UPI000F897047|nr:HNH endonuclease [Sphingomonas sp. TF3]RUN76502.1 hypothetical protein EJC47_11060 [Sphingomonas sp. TF3]